MVFILDRYVFLVGYLMNISYIFVFECYVIIDEVELWKGILFLVFFIDMFLFGGMGRVKVDDLDLRYYLFAKLDCRLIDFFVGFDWEGGWVIIILFWSFILINICARNWELIGDFLE